MRVTYARRCRITGEKLAEALADVESSRVLNWGVGGSGGGQSWINAPSLVRDWGDKALAALTMASDGVPVPQLLTLDYAKAMVGPQFPVVVRPSRGSRQGRGLYVCTTADEVARHYADLVDPRICVFVDTEKEFRVHVVNGRAIKVQQKFPGPAIVSVQQGRIRTHRNGWVFGYPEMPKPERGPIKDAAKQAVAALGLDIGAVDVGLEVTGRPVVFEVNSAAGLVNSDGSASRTFEKYVRHITEIWGD